MPNDQPLPKKAVLVVDDDQDIATVLESILVGEGYRVDVAYDGMDAMSRIHAHNYDAVVSDLMMPRMRGDTLYQEVIRDSPWMANRFLFVSGVVASADAIHFFTQAGVRWVEKPFHPDDVLQIVREIIAEAGD